MFDRPAFEKEKRETARAQYDDQKLQSMALDLLVESDKYGYGYQWTWLGMPVIQLPQDIIATQEIIWQTKPDVIIETGIAWGGSIVMYASLQQLIGKGKTIAVDRVLPEQNIDLIKGYPFSDRIHLLQGSSTDPEIVQAISSMVDPGDSVMVLLDSNHTHEHVLEELRLYAPLVTPGQYLVVSDTIVEDIPAQEHRPRPWGPGDNPKTALWEYLGETDRFEEDAYINAKLLTTFTPNGYMKCVK
jgi:cephalosporin hydroxylase